MSTKFVMGNEAIALGAIKAGVNLVCGYPGTPSTEILETVARENNGAIYVEWSINEKAALEIAAGAAYTGARSMVTMKQVGLNVASDPLMSLAYVGIKGGMVVVVADDPGPISSQTEQDTRHFARFSKLPVFDPVSPEEAYEMIQEAFEWSEQYHTPVLLRPTTRVCHGCASISISNDYQLKEYEGFIKDPQRWVIFPKLSYQNHLLIEDRNKILTQEFSRYIRNQIQYIAKKPNDNLNTVNKVIATGGISYTYTMECLSEVQSIETKVLKVATPFPFPEELALSFLEGATEVLVLEELDPVIERELIYLCGKYHLDIGVKGKLSGDVACAGENSVESIDKVLHNFFDITYNQSVETSQPEPPALPVRPPVLCAGCPHRASFYAVKTALKGRKAVFTGDIGCYTLGNANPLNMVDTCLCMGAGITIAQGLSRMEPDTLTVGFVGDSTFFASGMTGVANAIYNETDLLLILLDNKTTAMTGHQPHPGTGRTMMGNIAEKIEPERVLEAMGVSSLTIVNPLDLTEAKEAVKQAADKKGVRVIIFRSPCIAVTKPSKVYGVNSLVCIDCKRCIKELGCPAISTTSNGKVSIETSLCFGCGLCKQVCPVNAIGGKENE